MRNALIVLMLTSAASTQAAPAPPRDIELPANGRAIVHAELNGKPVTLRVDLDAPNTILLNPAAVTRLGLKSGIMPVRAFVGPVMLKGGASHPDLLIDGRKVKGMTIWFDLTYAEGVDGVISPAMLPYDIIRFRGETPLTGRIGRAPATIDRQGISTPFTMGSAIIPTRLSLSRPQSATNATGGRLIEQAFAAKPEGVSRDVEIAFGINRPMQRYRLGQAASIGTVQLKDVDVRMASSATTTDPDEIVITSPPKGKPIPGVLTIGRDALGACGSITFDRRAKQIQFDCP